MVKERDKSVVTYTIFSKNLLNSGKKRDKSRLSPFLHTGITFARLKQVEKVPQFKDILKSTVNGPVNFVAGDYT